MESLEISGRYLWPKPDVNALKQLTDEHLFAFVDKINFSASIKNDGMPSRTKTFKDPDTFFAAFSASPANTNIHLSDYSTNRKVYIEIKPPLPVTTIYISIEAPENDLQLAQNLLQNVVSKLGLKESGTNGTEAMSSINSRFFLPDPLTLPRFEKAVSYLESTLTYVDYFSGSYNLVDYFYGERSETKDKKDWIEGIKNNWKDVTESNANFYPSLTIKFDHRLSIIELKVSSQSNLSNPPLLTSIQKELGLIKIGEDPYRYRKSAATYKIGDWDRKRFVNATRDFFTDTFEGQEPVISEAFVTKVLDNNIERLQGCYKTATFLEAIENGSDSNNERAFLGLQGPKGLLLGISLNIKDKKLEFKSNIPPNEVEEKIIKYYKEGLQLSLTKTVSTGSAISSASETRTEKWWVKYLSAITVAIIGTTAVIVTLMRAVFTDYTLQITNPTQSSTVVNVPKLALNWNIYPKDALFKDPDNHPSASVLITHNGDSVQGYHAVRPPLYIELKNGEGTYLVQVQADKKAPPQTISVNYKKENLDSVGHPIK